MSAQNIALIIALILILITFSYFIGIYNKIVMLKNNVDKAFMNIDVILMQRAQEIPELVKVASKYMDYEKSVLMDLTNLRTEFLNAKTIDEKIKNASAFSQATKSFFAVSENYPELASNNNFVELQKRVSQLEDKIADRREFFNDSVNLYNIGIQEFPNSILAGVLGYKQRDLFHVLPAEKAYNGIQF